MNLLTGSSAVAIAAVFGLSLLEHLQRPSELVDAITDHGVVRRQEKLIAALVITFEAAGFGVLGASVWTQSQSLAAAGLVIASGGIAVFTLYLWRAIARAPTGNCGCGGLLGVKGISPAMIARNVGYAVVCGLGAASYPAQELQPLPAQLAAGVLVGVLLETWWVPYHIEQLSFGALGFRAQQPREDALR